MSAVEALSTPETIPDAPLPGEVTPVEYNADAELADLEAIFDRNETNNGSDRGDDGKFKSTNPEPTPETAEAGTESVLEGAEAGEATEAEGSTLTPSVPLPANWNGKDEVWKKIPDDIKADVAAIQLDLQSKLSSQGRQIAESKPLTDAVSEYKHLFEGRIDPVEGIKTLARAQERLDNPNTRLQTILGIIDDFGARDHIFQLLSGQAQLPAQPQQNISARDIQAVVAKELATDRASREANEELGRLSKDKPLYSEIPEQTMVQFIYAAKSVLGENASKDMVFNTAYDMATDSIPALKAKKMAAAKPAVVPKQVSPEAAKRANSVNVPSTATGKVREPSEDEQLEAIWAKHQRG